MKSSWDGRVHAYIYVCLRPLMEGAEHGDRGVGMARIKEKEGENQKKKKQRMKMWGQQGWNTALYLLGENLEMFNRLLHCPQFFDSTVYHHHHFQVLSCHFYRSWQKCGDLEGQNERQKERQSDQTRIILMSSSRKMREEYDLCACVTPIFFRLFLLVDKCRSHRDQGNNSRTEKNNIAKITLLSNKTYFSSWHIFFKDLK